MLLAEGDAATASSRRPSAVAGTWLLLRRGLSWPSSCWRHPKTYGSDCRFPFLYLSSSRAPALDLARRGPKTSALPRPEHLCSSLLHADGTVLHRILTLLPDGSVSDDVRGPCAGKLVLRWTPIKSAAVKRACLCPTCQGTGEAVCLNCLGERVVSLPA